MITNDNLETSRGLVDKLSQFLSPPELDLEEKSKRILAGLTAIITAPVLFLFSAIHLERAEYPLGILLLIAGTALAISVTFIRKFKSVTIFSRINIIFIGLLFLYLLVNSGPHGYMANWLYVFPLVTFFMLGRHEGLYYNAAFFLLALFYLLFQDSMSWTTTHEIEFKTRFLFSLFLVDVLAYIFEFVRHKFQEGMEQNQFYLEEEKLKLIAAKKEADTANQAKSEFMSNMSHELRTPLNSIIGFTEMIVNRFFGDLTEEQDDYLREVLNSGNLLLSLVNDILDISKVEAGKLQLNISDVNLKELLHSSLFMIKEKAIKHEIQVSTDFSNISGTIKADARSFKQILYNLLSNAMKFTPNGGMVSVGGRMVDCTFRPGFRDEDPENLQVVENRNNKDMVASKEYKKCVEIFITDSGIGLKPENLKRVFDRFEQVDNSKNRRFQGTGLGLAVSKTLVELHGGRIWAESEGEGKGSTFIFIIPVTPEEKRGRTSTSTVSETSN